MRRTWWIIPPVIVLDWLTKHLAAGLPAGGITLWPGLLALRYARNQGIAFSWLSGSPVFTLALSGLLICVLAALLIRKTWNGWVTVGLTLTLAGALGNWLDRLASGAVTDMIELLFIRFPVFNVADICVTGGCLAAAIGLLAVEEKDNGGTGKTNRL